MAQAHFDPPENNHLYNHMLFPLCSLNRLQPPNTPKVAYIAQMLTATHVQSIPIKETPSAVSAYAKIAAREHQHQQRLRRNLEHDAQFGRTGLNHVLIVLPVWHYRIFSSLSRMHRHLR